jgi:hypothetical protein
VISTDASSCYHSENIIEMSTKLTPPKRRLWNVEPTFPNASSNYFFKGVSTLCGLRIVEKCFENQFGKVCPAFQNLRLGSIKLVLTHAPATRLARSPPTQMASVTPFASIETIIMLPSSCDRYGEQKIAQFFVRYMACDLD